VGASDWSADVIPLAVQAGVNYWHKANAWSKGSKFGPIPDAIKSQPRESYYLEATVDRLSGYLQGPVGDADHFYNYVKGAVKASDIGYYDVLKFHYGYHSIDEVKTQTGFVDAFQRLKNEGLVNISPFPSTITRETLKTRAARQPTKFCPGSWTIRPLKPRNSSAAITAIRQGTKPGQGRIGAHRLVQAKDFGSIAMKTMTGVGRFMPQEPARRGKHLQDPLGRPKYAGSTPGSAIVKWVHVQPEPVGGYHLLRQL